MTAALAKIGFEISDKTRVWSVVDALFDAGYISESVSAQRFAMPTLQDIPKVAADAKISNVFDDAKHRGERIISIFTRNIVASLDSYAILTGYTGHR